MVICYLWIIKYFLRFRQCGTVQRSCQYFIITKSFQNAGALRINIVTQESSINTRIGSYLLLIKRLNQFQRFISRISEFLITFYLKRSQVEQTWGELSPIFLANTSDYKRKILYAFYQCLAFFPVSDRVDTRIIYFLFSTVLFFFRSNFFITFADKCGKSGIPIVGFQFPVLLGFEISYFQLTVDNQCQSRCLYTTDREYLFILTVFNGVKTGGVHS